MFNYFFLFSNEYDLCDFLKIVFFTLENPPFMQKIGFLFAAICHLFLPPANLPSRYLSFAVLPLANGKSTSTITIGNNRIVVSNEWSMNHILTY